MHIEQEQLGFLMSDIFRLMRHNFQEHVKGVSSLTFAQAKALRYISTSEGLRQVELAEKLDIKPITLARLIDLLEEKKSMGCGDVHMVGRHCFMSREAVFTRVTFQTAVGHFRGSHVVAFSKEMCTYFLVTLCPKVQWVVKG